MPAPEDPEAASPDDPTPDDPTPDDPTPDDPTPGDPTPEGEADTLPLNVLPDLPGALETIQSHLLGQAPHLTRVEVADRAEVSLIIAEQLWRLLGFPHTADEDVAFTDSDVEALRFAHDLMELGVLPPDSQSAMVRTWGRSFARLAEWEAELFATVALDDSESTPDPETRIAQLAGEVLPRVEALQTYVWRRHLVSATNRLLATQDPGSTSTPMAVCFVDIVGYTSQSKNLDEGELVAWIEQFEDRATGVVVDHGGRLIKTIGDEILLVTDTVPAAVEIALELTSRGADEEDPFPAVRAGLAYGEVVSRLGDVFGTTVNIAARLTSLARPGTILVDRGVYDELAEDDIDEPGPVAPVINVAGRLTKDDRPVDDDGAPYRLKRMRRTSVKGYSRLESWSLRRPRGARPARLPRRADLEGPE